MRFPAASAGAGNNNVYFRFILGNSWLLDRLDIYERQAQVCKAFANATRIHILDLLGKKERGVSEFQQILGLSKANLSQHLSILRTTGAVVTYRQGKAGLLRPGIR